MSTWTTPSYRPDALRNVCRFLPVESWTCEFALGLADFIVEDPGGHELPAGIRPGVLWHQVQDSPTIIADLLPPFNHEPSASLGKFVQRCGKPYFGLSGAYRTADIIRKSLRKCPPNAPSAEELNHCEALFKMACSAAAHSPPCTEARAQSLRQAYGKFYHGPRETIRGLIQAISVGGTAEAKRRRTDQDDFEEIRTPTATIRTGALSGWDVYSLGNAVILVNGLFGEVRPIVLTRVDITRVEKMLFGEAYALVGAYLRVDPGSGVGSVSVIRREQLARMVKVFDAVFELAASTDPKQAGLVARVFNVAHFGLLARLPGSLDARPETEQKAKWTKEGLYKVAGYEQVLGLFEARGLRERLELSMLYKVLPPPDYDYFGAAARQEAKTFDRSAFKGQVCEGNHWRGIMQYHRWLMIFAFHKVHGKCPGVVRDLAKDAPWAGSYPHTNPDRIPYEATDGIDMTGAFAFQERAEDIMDLVKDKALCPRNVDKLKGAGDRAKLKPWEKNQLMDWLQRDSVVDTSEISMETVFADVEADDKAEAKKPNQRWFFKAHTDMRLKQSEYEDSIGTYLESVPGAMLGISLANKAAALASIADPGEAMSPTMPVWWSFDIAGFSSNLNIEVHRALNRQWAEAFHRPELFKNDRVFTDGEVHYIKPGIHHRYQKTGVDYEGFAGKKLTFYHCAVMGYVVGQLMRGKQTRARGRFGCFIDDGVLRLEIDRKELSQHVDEISRKIEEIYSAASMSISWDKTLVSRVAHTFLGDVRALGRSLNPGTKATLRISNRSEDRMAGLSDDLSVLNSSCAGAIKSGEMLISVVAIHSMLLTDLMLKYKTDKTPLTVDMAISAYFPNGAGGLALPNPLAMAASVGAAPLEECLGNLRAIGLCIPGIQPAISEKLSDFANNLMPADRERVRGSTNIRSDVPRLKGDRIAKAVRRHLPAFVKQPGLKRILELDHEQSADFLQAQLSNGARFPLEIRRALVEAGPAALVDKLAGKFMYSRTAAAVVPRRTMKRMEFADRREAERVLHYQATGRIMAR